MKYSELEKILKKHGCYLSHEGGNHSIWKSPNGNLFPLGRHKSQDVPKGTCKAILKQAGIK